MLFNELKAGQRFTFDFDGPETCWKYMKIGGRGSDIRELNLVVDLNSGEIYRIGELYNNIVHLIEG